MLAFRGRRRAVDLALRCLALTRQHYASGITFVVLGAALVTALTSSSFSSRLARDDPAPPATKIELPPGYNRIVDEPVQPRLTYYLYEHEWELKLYQDILRTDYTRMNWMGLPDYIGEVHFIRVSSEDEQRYAELLIGEMNGFAGSQGLDISVRVVDLRQAH